MQKRHDDTAMLNLPLEVLEIALILFLTATPPTGAGAHHPPPTARWRLEPVTWLNLIDSAVSDRLTGLYLFILFWIIFKDSSRILPEDPPLKSNEFNWSEIL